MNKIEFRITKEVDLNDLVLLYKAAGWWSEKNDTIDFLSDLVKKTYIFLGAYEKGRLIGMGRSICDGVSDSYIQDVTVLPEYRNRGIGGEIIKKLVEELKTRGIKWIGLIGEPGTQSFYEKLGFSLMKDYVPMIHKGEDE
ncbi:MAG: GNAT family N-acetyltransferase [Candidatus Cloacimonadia bacterium]|jgi:spermidine synthase